jgi:hypothetical protein
VHREVINIYYTTNTFEFHEPQHQALDQSHLTLPIFRHVKTILNRVSREDVFRYVLSETLVSSYKPYGVLCGKGPRKEIWYVIKSLANSLK